MLSFSIIFPQSKSQSSISNEQIRDTLQDQWYTLPVNNFAISTNPQPDSITPILLPTEFSTFWDGDSWDSFQIIKKGNALHFIFETAGFGKYVPNQLYLPGLQLTLDSTYPDDFKYSSSDSILKNSLLSNHTLHSRNFSRANENILQMKSSYHNASQIAGYFLLYLKENEPPSQDKFTNSMVLRNLPIFWLIYTSPNSTNVSIPLIHPPLILTPFSYASFLWEFSGDVGTAVDYRSHWQATMGNQSKALVSSSSALNSIFEITQKKANTIKNMGVSHPSYSGAARAPYTDYKNFIALSSRNILEGGNCNLANDPPSKYACAYVSLQNLKEQSLIPGAIPVFSLHGENLSAAYNFITDYSQGSLLQTAISFENNLDSAILSFDSELSTSKSDSNSNSKTADSLKNSIEKNHPQLFSDFDDFSKISSFYLTPQSDFGTISELNSNLQTYLDQANTEQETATSISKSQSENYAALSISHYKNSSFLFSKAISTAQTLNESMVQLSSQACLNANSQISALESKINSTDSSFSQANSVSSSINSLNFAKSDYSSAQIQTSYGKKYEACKSAYSHASIGLISSQNPQEFSKNKSINDALLVFSSFIKSAKRLNLDSVSNYEAKYEELSSTYSSNLYVSESEIQYQIDSINRELNFLYFEQTQKYNSIRSNAQSLRPFSSQALTDFGSLLAPYRTKDLWSLHAFNNQDSLNIVLEKADSQTNNFAISVLSSQLCQNSIFIPNSASVSSQTRLDTGGLWQSKNPFNLSLQSPFSIKCDFSTPFSNDEIISKSKNLNSASSSKSELTLNFNSINPYETVSFDFSSEKIAVSQTQTSCLSKISSSGAIDFRVVYSLKPEYYPESLKVSIPWSFHSSGEATLSTNDGQISSGVWSSSLSGSPQIDFTISKFSQTTKSFEIIVRPSENIKISKENYLASPSSKSGSIRISYLLQIPSLPPCSKIELSVDEKSNSQISNLQLYSSDAKLSGPKIIYSSSAVWTSQISEYSPPQYSQSTHLSISVSYLSSDASDWVNSTLSSLRQKAISLNDLQAIKIADSAQNAFDAGMQKEAFDLISQLQKRLNSQVLDNSKSRIEFEEELQSAKDSLQTISSLNSTLFKESPNWKSTLNLAIEKSSSLWNEGNLEDARKTLRSQITSVNSKMQEQANSLFSSLSKDSISLSQALSTLSNPPDFILYSSSLNSASDSITTSNLSQSLLSLQNASEAISYNKNLALNSSKEQLFSQDLQAQKIRTNAQALSLEYDNYLQSLSDLSSAKHLSMPKLSSKEAKSIQDSLSRLLSDYKPKTPKTLEESLELLSSNSLKLDSANSSILSSKEILLQAFSSFESLAKNLAQTAQISIEQLEKKEPNSKALESLKEDFQSINQMLESQNYADAISLSEATIKRTTQASPASNSTQLPFEILVVSAIMVLIAAYLLLSQKPKKPVEIVAQPKVLSKA